MKDWALEDEKYFKEWSNWVKYFIEMGYNGGTEQILATKKMEEKYEN